MEKFADFRRAGKTVVLVSHAMSSMRSMCDQVAWLEHGVLTGVGAASEIVDDYVDESHVDRVETDNGGSRWGSGEVRITGVEVLDATGAAVSRVRTDDRVTFRIRYHAETRIDKPVFGFALETVTGTYAWAHNSRDGGIDVEAIEGAGTIDLHIPRLALQAGTFDMQVGITDYTCTHVFDHLTRATRVEVHLRTPHESGGIVALGGTWTDVTPSAADGLDGNEAEAV